MSKPSNLPTKLTEIAIANLPIGDKRYDIPDHQIRNLYLTVYPSGKKAWVFRYRASGKSKRFRIGDDSVSPAQARNKAKKVAGDVANGIDPNAAKQQARREESKSKEGTLRAFIDNRYEASTITYRAARNRRHPRRSSPPRSTQSLPA